MGLGYVPRGQLPAEPQQEVHTFDCSRAKGGKHLPSSYIHKSQRCSQSSLQWLDSVCKTAYFSICHKRSVISYEFKRKYMSRVGLSNIKSLNFSL